MDITSYLRMAVALLVVLALIALAAWLARRLGFASGTVRREYRRLSIVEAMALDAKRRVLLIKCDGNEHLVLLGPTSETVLGAPAQPSIAAPAMLPKRGASAPRPQPQSRPEPQVPMIHSDFEEPQPMIPTAQSMLAKRIGSPAPMRGPTRERDSRREPQLGPMPMRPIEPRNREDR